MGKLYFHFSTNNEGRPPCSPSVDDYLRRESLGCYHIGEKVQQFYVRVVQCMRVPRGLSDGKGTGSQQAYFQFELPSRDGLLEGAIGATPSNDTRGPSTA